VIVFKQVKKTLKDFHQSM